MRAGGIQERKDPLYVGRRAVSSRILEKFWMLRYKPQDDRTRAPGTGPERTGAAWCQAGSVLLAEVAAAGVSRVDPHVDARAHEHAVALDALVPVLLVASRREAVVIEALRVALDAVDGVLAGERALRRGVVRPLRLSAVPGG